MPSNALAAKVKPQTSIDLDRFERGEITEADYLDIRVDAAMAHVKGLISAERFQMIREVLLEMLETDPVLVEMTRQLLARGRHARSSPDT